MKFRIIYTGDIKTKFIKNGVEQYKKWNQRFIKIDYICLPLTKNLGKINDNEYKTKDFLNYKKYLSNSTNIVLDERGELLDSVSFSKKIDHFKTYNRKDINFIIGGPLGHSKEIFNYSNMNLSLSNMTFTHEMAVLLISEQLYRINKILNNEKYHY
ncbi:MAG: 23S rRNA (pseudouridine(1915)-N(3))-methyltransferase RlmH [Thermotogota bacterium]